MVKAERPEPRPGVMDIAAYVPGKSSAHGVSKVYKLSSNENPLGPSPRALAALPGALASLHLYPDAGGFGLRRALATRYGLKAADLVHAERWGTMAALHGDDIVDVPLHDAVAELKTVPPEFYEAAKTFFG